MEQPIKPEDKRFFLWYDTIDENGFYYKHEYGVEHPTLVAVGQKGDKKFESDVED